MDFSRFRFISFDCYGTLIDWETGIVSALSPILAAHGLEAGPAEILGVYADLEREAEAGVYLRYRDILRNIVSGLGRRFGFTPTSAECSRLPESLRTWLPFPDTVPSLKKLKERYRLGILSNVDDDLFAGSARLLEVEFDLVITAQQAGAYKPSARNFELMKVRIAGLGLGADEWLHVAQSRPHDIVPARALGIANVWVNRPLRYGASAVTEATVEPDAEFGSLAEFVSMVENAG